jgi:hypothetical protein
VSQQASVTGETGRAWRGAIRANVTRIIVRISVLPPAAPAEYSD